MGAEPTEPPAAARKDLARRLERESEMVPCPKCQWVNEDLIARYRRRKYRPLAWITLAILSGSPWWWVTE